MRFVGCSVAIATIGCVVVFVVFPLFRIGFAPQPSDASPSVISTKGEETLTGLSMRGETEKEPFFVFSDQTYTTNKHQYLENPYIKVWMNKNLIRCWSKEGVFDPHSYLLTLTKEARVLTESLLLILTEEATIDAKNRNAWGSKPVRGFYTQSILKGTGFRYNGKEERLYISGPVHITIY